MMKLILNDELQLQYPEGFHVLSEEERSKLNTSETGEWVGLSNPDLHILISLGWKKVNGFALMMLSEKDLAGKMEKEEYHILLSFLCKKSFENGQHASLAGYAGRNDI